MSLSGNIGANALFDLTGADREAKAYAFLYAAFRRTEISANPVRDAVDCLIPFMAPYLEAIPGQTIKVESVRDYMQSKFGFDFPLYAMQQLISELPKHGLAEWNKIAKAHIAKPGKDETFKIAKEEIETDFDHISQRLSKYAVGLKFTQAPPSGTWGDALIHFLKGTADPTAKIAANVRGAIVDAQKSEVAIVGSFISRLYETDSTAFEKVLNIFLGVLVEEFISSVSEIGSNKDLDVVIFYDTAVLLRLLGTSGRLLKTATEELTRYLQDLGCKIHYFGGNESEAENIFSTIVHIKDIGGELEGETAEAIASGEINITQIRMLQNSFPERLAALNVFPGDNISIDVQTASRHQIDESGFSSYLYEQSRLTGRRYSVENRVHDAKYLGDIMRLRRGFKTRDFANCGYLFITSNKFLAASSRRYLLKDGTLQPQQFPPMLSVGQMATIAWLMKDRKLAPEKAGRELLANCYAAVRPDAEWFRHFREGMEQAVGSIEAYGREGTNTLTLKAARRMAQEESLGNATLVRALNMAEILSRAEAEQAAVSERQQAELEALKEAAEREKREIKDSEVSLREKALADARTQHEKELALIRQEADAATQEMLRQVRIDTSRRWAHRIVVWVRGALLCLFALSTAWSIYLRISGQNALPLWLLTAILGVATIITFANFLKVPHVVNWIPNLEKWLATKIYEASTPAEP